MHKPREPSLEGVWETWGLIGTGPGVTALLGVGVRVPETPVSS